MKLPDLLQGLDRSIPYYPSLAQWLGSRNAAILLAYLHYLCQRSHSSGWVYKRRDEIQTDTCLSFEEQRNARAILQGCGILQTKEDRLNHRLLFRVDRERLMELWNSKSEVKITTRRRGESARPGVKNHLTAEGTITSPLILEHRILHRKNPPSASTAVPTEAEITTHSPAPAEPSGASSGGSEGKRKRERKPKAEKPKAEKPEASERGYKFADWFKTLLPADIRLAATWRDQWAHCFDDLLRLDHREDKAIAAVCQWARKDDFWQKNFLSPMKLRNRNGDGIQYFDVFTEAMKAPPKGAAAAMAQKKAGEYVLKPEDGPTVFNPMEDDIVIDGERL